MFLWQPFAKWLLLLTNQINNITPPIPSPNWTNQNLQNPSVYHLFQVKVLTVPFNTSNWININIYESRAFHNRANCTSNWIFPRLACFQKRKCQSESKLRLCFAYWFFGIPPSYYFRIIISYLKMSGIPCERIDYIL